MTKQEWDALDEREKNDLVVETVFGIKREDAAWLRRIDPALGAHCSENRIPLDNYTTSRDACALVLDVIEKRGLIDVFNNAVSVARDEMFLSLWTMIRLQPSDACYCALKAVEEEE